MGEMFWLSNYAATHPNATLQYHDSDTILHIARDASYLCEERARSQSGGHSPLATQLVNNGDKPPTLPTDNGHIHTLCQITKTVMSSAAEAKIAATFLNAKDALPIRTNLEELRHPQLRTPMQVNNTIAVVSTNDTIK